MKTIPAELGSPQTFQGPTEIECKIICISVPGFFLGRRSDAFIRFSEASLIHGRERTVVISCHFDFHAELPSSKSCSLGVASVNHDHDQKK